MTNTKCGADTIIETLISNGVEVCFTNPGTSEMHLLASIDKNPKMRAVLGLFEGVVTGAADGYGRMTGKPAATLLHLGPGLGNGIANLHNAKKAFSPIVNLIGEHATTHLKYNAPLTSDIKGLAKPVSGFVKRVENVSELGKNVCEAIAFSKGPPCQVSTLIIPADIAWGESGQVGTVQNKENKHKVNDQALSSVVEVLEGSEKVLLMLGGDALSKEGLVLAGRIKAKTNCDLIAPTFNSRIPRGEGRVQIEKLAYFSEAALAKLSLYDHLVLIGAPAPVSFFGYPEKESYLVPNTCALHEISSLEEGGLNILKGLVDQMNAPDEPAGVSPLMPPPLMTGELNPATIAAAVGHYMPKGAIISDESATSGLALGLMTQNSAEHDWLDLTGGSIGQGLPLAVGAAIACPERKVICLSGDGSAMYTIQSLWTMARENLDITIVVFANKSYGILNIEFTRVGAGIPGETAKAMMSMDDPEINFCDLAKSMGVSALRVETAEEFNEAYKVGIEQKGPTLIEAMINPIGQF